MSHTDREGEAMPALRWLWVDVLVVATTTLHNVAARVVAGLDQLDDLARAHANYKRDQVEWADKVVRDIERL